MTNNIHRNHISFDRTYILLLVLVLELITLLGYFFYYENNSYLPSPFLRDKFDTFMDLFNPLWWATHAGAYTLYQSVYPPINFVFLKAIDFILSVHSHDSPNAFLLRDDGVKMIYFFFICYLIAPFFLLCNGLWGKFTGLEKILIYFIILFSTPMLFVLERGNLILFSLPLLGAVLSSRGFYRLLFIALLINLKPYFLILTIFEILNKKWNDFAVILALSFAITVLFGLLQGESFHLIVINLLGFSASNDLFSPYDVITYPASLSAYTYLLNHDGFYLIESAAFKSFIGSFIEILKWISIGFLIYSIGLKNSYISYQKTLFSLVMIITNLGISVGGYSLIFYFAFIPVLLEMRYKKTLIFFLVAMISPLDLISVYNQYSDGAINVYLSSSIIQGFDWDLMLGSAIRPLLNSIVLGVMGAELLELKKRSRNK